MRKYLYIRDSIKEKTEDKQLVLKDKYNLRNSEIFIDKATGKSFDRPAYENLKAELQRGDTLIVMSLDRLGRDKKQILKELKELNQKGVRLIVDNLPTTQMELEEHSQSIFEMINNILIEVYTNLADEELKRNKVNQQQALDSMPINENEKKYSKKTGREIGRPNKQKNLTTEQERYINAWINKSIKLSDCIKFSGLSEATLYRIKRSLNSKKTQSKLKRENVSILFDSFSKGNTNEDIANVETCNTKNERVDVIICNADDNIADEVDKFYDPNFYTPKIPELKKGDKLLEFKYGIIDETPNKFEEDEELNEYSPFFQVYTVEKTFKNSYYIEGKKYDSVEDFIYLNDENYMKLLVFMEKKIIYAFTVLTDDDRHLYLLKNKQKKIYRVLVGYLKQLSHREKERLFAKIVYRLEDYGFLDTKSIERMKKALKPIFLR